MSQFSPETLKIGTGTKNWAAIGIQRIINKFQIQIIVDLQHPGVLEPGSGRDDRPQGAPQNCCRFDLIYHRHVQFCGARTGTFWSEPEPL